MLCEVLKDFSEFGKIQRVVRNVVRVKQKESPSQRLGKLGGTAEFIRPLHGNMQGTFLFLIRFKSLCALL